MLDFADTSTVRVSKLFRVGKPQVTSSPRGSFPSRVERTSRGMSPSIVAERNGLSLSLDVGGAAQPTLHSRATEPKALNGEDVKVGSYRSLSCALCRRCGLAF